MPLTKYSKWEGVDWESLSLEDLLERIADFLLQSGFESQYSRYWGDEQERTLESLRDAIMRALMEGLLSDDEMEALSDERGELNEKAVAQLLDRLIERLIEEGYISLSASPPQQQWKTGFASRAGRAGKPVERSVKFEMTDK